MMEVLHVKMEESYLLLKGGCVLKVRMSCLLLGFLFFPGQGQGRKGMGGRGV